MNTLSCATSSMLPNNLRGQYTPGLQGHPSTSLIGACAYNFGHLLSSINVGSNGLSLASVVSFWFSPTHSCNAFCGLGTSSIKLTGGMDGMIPLYLCHCNPWESPWYGLKTGGTPNLVLVSYLCPSTFVPLGNVQSQSPCCWLFPQCRNTSP